MPEPESSAEMIPDKKSDESESSFGIMVPKNTMRPCDTLRRKRPRKVTPPFPIVIAANPVVHFEGPRQPTVVTDPEKPLQFSLGCQVVLPPESFISIRLPFVRFVYGTEVEDKVLNPLKPFEQAPELTAWIMQGTALQVICKGDSAD